MGEGVWLIKHADRLTPSEMTARNSDVNWMGGRVGPKAGASTVAKRRSSIPVGSQCSLLRSSSSYPTLQTIKKKHSLLYSLVPTFLCISAFTPKSFALNRQLVKWVLYDVYSRSQWLRGLRRRSSAASLLRLWTRNLPGAWMFVCCECCVLSGRGLCEELVSRQEESYRLWRVVVCDLETSWMWMPWPTWGFYAKNKQTRCASKRRMI